MCAHDQQICLDFACELQHLTRWISDEQVGMHGVVLAAKRDGPALEILAALLHQLTRAR
ncbi:MAG: hypothetical protein U0165_06365 [Polyangiaceae bacterium]